MRLPLDFIGAGACEGTETIQVLDLRAGAEFLTAGGTDGNIRFETQNAFFHIAGIHIQVAQDSPDAGGIGQGCRDRVQIRLGDDLQQWDSSPVVIHQGIFTLVG